jgi:hypothetical protein
MLFVRFIDSPNGPIVVQDVAREVLQDEVKSTRIRRLLSRSLGGAPVLLRCVDEVAMSFSGDPALHRYGLGASIDAMPLVGIDLDAPFPQAA